MSHYITNISHSVGKKRDLSTLTCDEDALATLGQHGHSHYFDANGDALGLLVSSLTGALESAKLKPDEIGAVVFAPPTAQWSQQQEDILLLALETAGLTVTRLMGVSLQGCGAVSGLLDSAAAMADETKQPVITIVSGLHSPDAPRFNSDHNLVFSDGVACCVVWPGDRRPQGNDFQYRIMATHALVDISLSALGAAKRAQRFLRSIDLVSAVANAAARASNTRLTDLDLIITNNTNNLSRDLVSEATSCPRSLVWQSDVEETGHFYSADLLIGLWHAASAGKIGRGNTVMLLGWSPHAVSSVILSVDDTP